MVGLGGQLVEASFPIASRALVLALAFGNRE